MTGPLVWETVAATAHRPQHLTQDEIRWIRAELPRVTVKLRDQHGMAVGCSGFALGGDLWWANELVRAGVDLWAHIPFPQQPDPWRPEDQAEWRRLLGLAKQVTYYGQHYDVRLLHARNDGMLRPAEAVVAIYKRSKTSGGTASAFRKARGLRLPIVHMNPERRTVALLNLPALAGAGHSPA